MGIKTQSPDLSYYKIPLSMKYPILKPTPKHTKTSGDILKREGGSNLTKILHMRKRGKARCT
ncbi:MAG TPA: hypothetical protein VMT57_02655 [Candidatus Thermoplasmatota archaeon]|nr:hypothetical protein [Candidatus Thermoplasmatota archaeon]